MNVFVGFQIPKDRLSFSQATSMHSKWQSELFQTKCPFFHFQGSMYVGMWQRRHFSIVMCMMFFIICDQLSLKTLFAHNYYSLWRLAHFEDNVPNFSKHMLKLAIPSKIWVSDPPKVSWSEFLSLRKAVFRPLFLGKSLFWPISTQFTPPHDIHRWKAMDLSFHVV